MEKKYYCNFCQYSTDKIYRFKRHLETKKHVYLEKELKKDNFSKDNVELNSVDINKDLIITLINQNKEIMNFIKDETHYMTTYNNNINNNTFNLNLFLNETCKDAINMKDFIESIEVSIADLKKLGKLGYIEGISGLMIQKLNDLDITKRPIHSSDIKREIIYIKENDTWEKDNTQKERLKKVILEITKLETRALENKYKLMYPQCETDRDSREHNEYWKIFHNAVGGAERNMDLLNSKVIRKIVQNVTIDKSKF